MKTKNRRKHNRKKVGKLADQVLDEMIAEGYFEELPGGYIKLTPAGVAYKKQHAEEHRLFVQACQVLRDAENQKRDLQIKQAILQTTRQIVG